MLLKNKGSLEKSRRKTYSFDNQEDFFSHKNKFIFDNVKDAINKDQNLIKKQEHHSKSFYKKDYSNLDVNQKRMQRKLPENKTPLNGYCGNILQDLNSLSSTMNCIHNSPKENRRISKKRTSLFYPKNINFHSNCKNKHNKICFSNNENSYSDLIGYEIMNNNQSPNFDLLKLIENRSNEVNYFNNEEKVLIDTFSESSNIFLTKLKSMRFSTNFFFDPNSKNENSSKNCQIDSSNKLNNTEQTQFMDKNSKFHSNEKLRKIEIFKNSDKKVKFVEKNSDKERDLNSEEYFSNNKTDNCGIISNAKDNIIRFKTNKNFYSNLRFKNNIIGESPVNRHFSPVSAQLNFQGSNKIFDIKSHESSNNYQICKTKLNATDFSKEISHKGKTIPKDENNYHNKILNDQIIQSEIGLIRKSPDNLINPTNDFSNVNLNNAINKCLTHFSINGNCSPLNNSNKIFINPLMINNQNRSFCNCCSGFYLKNFNNNNNKNPTQSQFSPFHFNNGFKINKTPEKINANKDKIIEQEKKLECLAETPAKKNYYKKLLENMKKINHNNNMDLNLDFILKRDKKDERINEKNEKSEISQSHCSSFDIEFYANKEEENSQSFKYNHNFSENSLNNFELNEILKEEAENSNMVSYKSFANSKLIKNPQKNKVENKKTKSLKQKHVLFEQEIDDVEINNSNKENTNCNFLLLTDNKSFKKSNMDLLENDNFSTSFLYDNNFSKKQKNNHSLKSQRSQNKKRKLILLHNIYDSISDVEDNPIDIRDRFLINEKSMLKFFWDIMVLVMILYSATIEVFMLTFYTDERKSLYFYFEVFSDLIFLIDVVLNFFIPYYEENKSIGNLNLIALNYLKKWFVFDLISSLPINFLLLIFDFERDSKGISTSLTLRSLDSSILETPNLNNFVKENFKLKTDNITNIDFEYLKNTSLTSISEDNNSFIGRILLTTFQSKPNNLLDYYFSRDFIFLFLRWLRLLRIVKLLKNDEKAKIFQDIVIYKDTKINKITKLVFLFFLLMHISSCLWCYLGRLVPENNEYRSWMKNLIYEQEDFYDIYIASLYFNVVTFFTVGFGDILSHSISERVYNCLILIIGNLLYSFGISSLSSIFTNLTEFENKQKDRLQVLEKIDQKHKLPRQLYLRIKNAINKSHLDGEGSEKFELLDSLPYGLRREMILSMHQKGISKIKFFQCEEKDFIVFVIPLLRINILNKDDILMAIGSVVEEMNIVNKGALIVCLDKLFDNMDIAQILPSNHFGDILIYLNEKCPYLVKCQSKNCEILTLMKSDYNKVKISFNKIILKILKISCDFLEKLEKNKQVVISLYDEGVPLKDVKNIINKLYYFFVNVNFENIFYENEFKPDQTTFDDLSPNNTRNKNSLSLIQQNNQSDMYMVSVEDFILHNDVSSILKFINTKMTKEDFEEIFFSSLIDDSPVQETIFYKSLRDLAANEIAGGDEIITNSWAFRQLTRKINEVVEPYNQIKNQTLISSPIKNNYVLIDQENNINNRKLTHSKNKNHMNSFKEFNQEKKHKKLLNQSSNINYLNTRSSFKESPKKQKNKKLNREEYNFYFNNKLQNQLKSTERKLDQFLKENSSDGEESNENISIYNESKKSLKNMENKLYRSNTYIENLDIIDEETSLKKRLKHMYSNKINQLKKLKTGKKSIAKILGLDESEIYGNEFDYIEKNDENLMNQSNNNRDHSFKYKNYYSDENININNSEINNTISKLLGKNNNEKFTIRNNLKTNKIECSGSFNVNPNFKIMDQLFSDNDSKKDFKPNKDDNMIKKDKLKKENIFLKSSDLIDKMFFPNAFAEENLISNNNNPHLKNFAKNHEDQCKSIKEDLLDLNETLKTIENADETKRNLIEDLGKPDIIKCNSKQKIFQTSDIKFRKEFENRKLIDNNLSLNLKIQKESFNKKSENDKEIYPKKEVIEKNNKSIYLEKIKNTMWRSEPTSFKSRNDSTSSNKNLILDEFENQNIDKNNTFSQKNIKIDSFLEKLKRKKNLNIKNQRKSKLLEKISDFNSRESNNSNKYLEKNKNPQSYEFKYNTFPRAILNNQNLTQTFNNNLKENINTNPNRFILTNSYCNLNNQCNCCKLNNYPNYQINNANNYNYYSGPYLSSSEFYHGNPINCNLKNHLMGCSFQEKFCNNLKVSFEISKNYSIEFYGGKYNDTTNQYHNEQKNVVTKDDSKEQKIKIILNKITESENEKNTKIEKKHIIESHSEISNGNNRKNINCNSDKNYYKLNKKVVYKQNNKILKKLDKIISYFSILENGNDSSSYLANHESDSEENDIIIEDFEDQ